MDVEGIVIKEKKKMISEDEADHLWKCGRVWREYVAGNEVIVVTEIEICPTALFGKYFNIIQKGIDKGLVTVLTLSQVKAEHLEMCLVEF